MQYIVFILFVSFHLYVSKLTLSCQLFSDNPEECLEKTSDEKCNYNYFESRCIVENKTSLGCIETLNEKACLHQLTNIYGEEVQCTFNKRCKPVLKFQLQNQGCLKSYNKYACFNIVNADCYWENSQCQPLKEIKETANSCEESYLHSVTYATCSKLQNLLCMSSGFTGQYHCITIQEQQLQTLQCTQQGLTKKACVSIQTEGQECIFKNQMCRNFEESEIKNCLMDLNRLACLSIKNPKISCQWIENSCYSYIQSNESQQNEILEVNISVCQSIQGLYKYDSKNAKCIEIFDFQNISCNTLGLSRDACLKIKNQNCIFYEGKCQEVNEQDLETYSCNMDLNEMTCLNLRTKFQYCKWNGNKCERIFMNQDINCPLELEDIPIKVNGNVCQAISKLDVLCKYDQKTNLCITSQIDNDCNTPYLNKKGCLSITANKKACQWINQACTSIEIKQYFTTCESLGYANPYTCSQVFENNTKGCYYDKIQEKCIPLQIKVEQDAQQEQIYQQKLDLQFLNSVSCENQELGLNRVACGSITTNGVACMWRSGKCVFIENKEMISAVPCLNLEWANARACNYAEFQKEICRYDKDQISCVTSAKDDMKCEEMGLNRYGCMIAKGFCYFNEELSLCLNDANITEQLTCDKNSPSKPMCLSITKEGEYCIWQQSNGKCSKVNIPFNTNCLSLNAQVNRNTCALIQMSYPDYDLTKEKSLTENYGYCKYDNNLNICTIKTDFCKTKCCTEDENIGINPHSCSKFSSKEPGVYCYFEEGRCKELTSELVNTVDEQAVKDYYNYKQFTCSQMNSNSCHMIEWSPSQRCAYFQTSCININLKEQPSLKFLTEETTITNKYTCYAIEAELQDDKYFTYDPIKNRCIALKLESETPFAKCEDAKGNRNLCLRYTGNNYCKWNSVLLQCETIMNYQFDNIQTCDSFLNIKACIENKVSPCFFSFESDKCQYAPKEVECDYFNTLGKVSEKVCKLIIKAGQICQFKDYLCAKFETYENKCDVQGANSIACYNNMNGNCRWDSITLQCYENFSDINTLSCSSNLNKILCLQVLKEPCYWNEEDLQCQRFFQMPNAKFQLLNPNNLYTKDACSLITGIGYIYQSDKCVVLPDTSNTNECSKYWMNEYACLYLTKGYKCYYDVTEQLQRMKCKPFQGEYSQCQDENSQILINIEVCMNIPKACVFEQSSLRCLNVEIGLQEKCSNLAGSIKEKKYYNKQACSSINPENIETYGSPQCYQDQQNFQNCQYEKYCFWDVLFYSCNIYLLEITFFDFNHQEKHDLKVCKNNSTKLYEDYKDGCSFEIKQVNELKFVDQQQIGLQQECSMTNTTCQSDEDCKPYQNSTIQLDYVEGNIIIIYPYNYTQTCEKRCGFKGQKTNFCEKDTDCGQEYITINNIQYTDLQICRIMKRRWHYEDEIIQQNTTLKPQDDQDIIETYNQYINENQTITTYLVNVTIPTKVYDKSREENCEEDDKGCYCQTTKEQCKYPADCPKIASQSLIYNKACLKQSFIFKEPYCISTKREIDKCKNIYAKALCLEMVKESCFFDINQGGCNKLEGNEDKLPECTSISMNSCFASKTKKVACSIGEKSSKPGDACFGIIKVFNDCKEIQFYNSKFICSKVKKEDAQSSLCARATDECRLSAGSYCVSDPELNSDGTCKCDESYSQTLCEKCNCDFTFFGFCQQTKQTFPYDINNPYFYCYRINLLDIKDVKLKQQACASVPQACLFRDQCEDATHITCDDLLGMTVVSLKACQKCKDQPVQYDPKKFYCLALNEGTHVNQCQYLNKVSCLKNSRNVKCKWDQSECKEIQAFQITDKVDCSILNYDACYQKQENLCWFDPELSQCTEFDPFKAQCEFVQDQQILCNLSMHQICVWQDDQCSKQDTIPPNICQGLNKYACLNQKLISCGWSENQECVELINIINYTNFLQSAQENKIDQFNAQTCSLITEAKNYLIDQQFKCKEVTSIDLIYCNTPGINQQSCIKLSIGKCKYYNNICQQTNEINLECQSYLNKEACLSQKAQCKFTDKCELFINPNLNQILNEVDFGYSDYMCLTVDLSTKPTTSLIFLESKDQCIDVSDQKPTIIDCQLRGMNKNACLQKTTQTLCEFKDNQCQFISKESQSTCSQTLNWFACVQSDAQCKFVNSNCEQLLTTDNCELLELQQAIVNENVCVKTNDVPCKYNANTRGCSKVDTHQKCSISGLNEKSCIFFTNGQVCKYEINRCIPYYQQAKCTDKINKDKCLSLRDRSQNCQFDETLGCKQIIDDLSKCLKFYQTNPSTCSKATDIPCYYNLDTRMCQQFANPSQFETPSRSQDWQNKISFNILTCQMYDIDEKKTVWNDGCQETTQIQLNTLECKNYLNYYTCVNLYTPLQYCQYINNICYEKDWYTYTNQQCKTITNINHGNFCQATADIGCKYDLNTKNCVEVVDGETIQCQNGSLFHFGYNKIACEKSQDCIFIDKCQQYDQNNLYYCSQAKSIEHCKNVLLEGCYRNSQQQCSIITSLLQESINCSDVENKVGCIKLKTKGQFCRYYNNKCQNENILDYKNKKCTDINMINTYEFCEYTRDIECIYDPSNNSCIDAKQEIQDLTCPRGLNRLACIPLNSKSLQCQFFNYCYGQNQDILNCNQNSNECCQKALTMESCLFQTKFECQWNNEKCTSYQANQISCNTIQNASRTVCYLLIDTFCIFDQINLKCEEIVPETCDQVQSEEQCKRIPKIPCQWNKDQDECQYKQMDLSDSCEFINNNHGNYKACIQIQRSGQMCAFIDYECQSFTEIQYTNNCLDYINQNACLQQTISQCYWDQNVVNESNSSIKYCKPFEELNSSKCEKNLSFLSCLGITTNNTYCQWINNQCESFNIDINNKLVWNTISQVNVNVCSLITDIIPIMYDKQNMKCKQVTDFEQLTCNPPLMGINMISCVSIKNQLCYWDSKTKTCKAIGNQKYKIANQEEMIQSTCQITGRTPISCSLLEFQLPCGGSKLGCEDVNLETVQCNHIGLNKYACLNLTSQSCKWVLNKELNLYQCQEHIPFDLCSKQPEQVNAILCSLVNHNDPCAYNKVLKQCQWSSEYQKSCDTLGINEYGCALIENCVFLKGKCIKFTQDLNLNCQDAEKAHYKVCAEITSDQCKYSELKNGCVSPDSFDSCQVKGINELGCNAKEPTCSWIENKCECIRVLAERIPCQQIQDYDECKLRNECYYVDSYAIKVNVELIKSQSQGRCKEKTCSDRNNIECEGQIVYGYICYLDKQGICQPAHDCKDIKNAVQQCSNYSIKDIPCVENIYDSVQCETLMNCQQLDMIGCQNYLEHCIYSDNQCQNKECISYMDQISCPKRNCQWKNSQKECMEQVSCELNKTEKECNEGHYRNKKCGWFGLSDCQSGCRYLHQAFVNCQGTQIKEFVCIQYKDVCLQCEEITDGCLCLEQQEFCHYDVYRNICQSKGCENYNQETCPTSRCYFKQDKKICLPQCRFRYNKQECGRLDDCYWEQEQGQCIEIIKISLPDNIGLIIPDAENSLIALLLIICLSTII